MALRVLPSFFFCSVVSDSPPQTPLLLLSHNNNNPHSPPPAPLAYSSSSFSIRDDVAPSYLEKHRRTSSSSSRRALLQSTPIALSFPIFRGFPAVAAQGFTEIENSGGVKALDIRLGDGSSPLKGDQVSIHYYGRLAAKQGWRFDSTYDHVDAEGNPIPFVFVVGSGKVISGIDAAVKSMKVGGVRRIIIPSSQGYQNTTQEPIPPDFSDRQRLFTTIFNPTRLANGEGSTLGILVFDIELVSVKHT